MQRAVADLLRDPACCLAARAGRLGGYALSPVEQEWLVAVARHPGVAVGMMLYRASRLVGISRRAPEVVDALGENFAAVFNAYLLACPHAPAEFDDEGLAFRRFVVARCGDLVGYAAASAPKSSSTLQL